MVNRIKIISGSRARAKAMLSAQNGQLFNAAFRTQGHGSRAAEYGNQDCADLRAVDTNTGTYLQKAS